MRVNMPRDACADVNACAGTYTGSCLGFQGHTCTDYTDSPTAEVACAFGATWTTSPCAWPNLTGRCLIVDGCSSNVVNTYPLNGPPSEESEQGAKDACSGAGGTWLGIP